MSASGQKQTFSRRNRHVRFNPESGLVQCKRQCPLWAKSGHGSYFAQRGLFLGFEWRKKPRHSFEASSAAAIMRYLP
jgi:hypothetical protein